MIKKNDIIICVLVAIFCIFSAALIFSLRGTPAKVIISQDNTVLHKVSLYENREIKLPHNTVVIENGVVFVSEADCKNQICVNTPKISKDGEQIICLPNRVIVEVSE